MVTLKDVAKKARVSVTAASYAMNNTGSISAATKQRILQAAEELNYHPNAFARNLKGRKTRTIGVFISRFGGSFYDEILEGIHLSILDTDYELIVCPESRSQHKHLTQRQVDGAIVFDSKVNSQLLLKLAAPSFPIVVLDRYLEAECLFPILIDNPQGAKAVFHHLYNHGRRKIYFISGATDSFDNAERMQAFLAEAETKDLQVQVFQGNFTEQSGYDVGRIIIDTRDMPEAVFCANDQMAIGWLRAMKECHIRCPEDIAVVGFDDILIAKYLQPSLTTIGASRFSWGSLAATHLIDFLESAVPVPLARIPTQLIPRESS